jgi:hypothetical protein
MRKACFHRRRSRRRSPSELLPNLSATIRGARPQRLSRNAGSLCFSQLPILSTMPSRSRCLFGSGIASYACQPAPSNAVVRNNHMNRTGAGQLVRPCAGANTRASSRWYYSWAVCGPSANAQGCRQGCRRLLRVRCCANWHGSTQMSHLSTTRSTARLSTCTQHTRLL